MNVRFNSDINQSYLLTASQLKGRGADQEQVLKTISAWKAVQTHPASKHQAKRSIQEQHRLFNLLKTKNSDVPRTPQQCPIVPKPCRLVCPPVPIKDFDPRPQLRLADAGPCPDVWGSTPIKLASPPDSPYMRAYSYQVLQSRYEEERRYYDQRPQMCSPDTGFPKARVTQSVPDMRAYSYEVLQRRYEEVVTQPGPRPSFQIDRG